MTDIWTPKTAYLAGAIGACVWMVILFGLKEVMKLKRLSMQVSFDKVDPAVLETELHKLEGVHEVVASREESAVYLKITKAFDTSAARALLAKYA